MIPMFKRHLLLLTTAAVLLGSGLPGATVAGGHTGPKQPQAAINIDASKRSDVTGTVLVTGSNRGIGLELARNYAMRGWNVIATARKPETATELQAIAAEYDNVLVEQMDLLDHAGIDALAERLKDIPIDVLLNNAAILGEPNDQNLGSFDYELFGRVIDVNVIGTTKMAEAFLPHVEKSDMKKIVAITSTQGSIASVRSGSIAFYNTSKAALNMIMRSNSRALKNKGVTVALISPGQVDTDMMNLALDRAGVSFELLTPQQSAEAVINVIDQYGLELSGRFVAHTGTEIPW